MLSIGIIFWIIMLISLILGFWVYRGPEGRYNWWGFGGSFILWILLCLLGWKVFGAPIGG